MNLLNNIDFFQLEGCIWIAEQKTNVPAYDFQFHPLLHIARPRFDGIQPIIARIGAIADYQTLYANLLDLGFRLINSPQDNKHASELEAWYPHIKAHTPKSITYEQFPNLELIEQDFDFPIFIKGSRQTSKHDPKLCIAYNEADLDRISKAYQENDILHWQKVVCREYVPLQKLTLQVPHKVPLSYEFRSFWWKGQLVGVGSYWSQFASYNWSNTEADHALRIAREAAQCLQIPFLVIDLALTEAGEWIIIECNDAQESGYCGVQALQLWQNIIKIEQQNK